MDHAEREIDSSPETKITEAYDGFVAADVRVPALTILAHPEVARVGERVILPELNSGATIRLSRVEPHFAHPGSTQARALDEVHMSRGPVLLSPGPGTGHFTVDRASSSTPVNVSGDDLAGSRTLSADEVAIGVVLLLGHRVVLLLHLDAAVTEELPSYGMVGASFEMLRLRQEIRVAARMDVPVLLRGESGTGKELLARAIHEASHRSSRPYLTVNMAAVPSTLAASELFGATKGAYTGADRKKSGFFQRAHGGSLFLDEIGDTPGEVQPLLLRTLENGEIQPLGGAETHRVDVRVIAATDADLEAGVEGGGFRKPLLHRLAGYEIFLPPLRARRSDFGRLLFHFLRRELARLDAESTLANVAEAERPWPPAGLVARLARHDWPGNIRQLKNVARRMAIARVTGTELRLGAEFFDSSAAEDNALRQPPAQDAEADLRDTRGVPVPQESAAESGPPSRGWRPVYRKPSEVSEEEMLAALREHRYELKATAEALGVSRGSLYALVSANPSIRKATDLQAGEIEAALEEAEGELKAAAQLLKVSAPGLKRRLTALGLISE